ncbi:MAG: hypothetical protein ACM3O3_11620 [Syntrophothermus sp.]
MKINPIRPDAPYQINSKSVEKKENNNKPEDSLQISGDAMKIDPKEEARLEEIRTKMKNGFYNSPEVINKVAENILKVI